MKKTIVLLGRLSSKGFEYAFVKDRILQKDFKVIVIDTSTRGAPQLQPDIAREEVARAAGVRIEDVIDRTDESKEIEVMMDGAAKVVQELYRSGKLDGVMCLGGSRGTAIGTAAMRALPFGIPKVMVSTIASGDVSSYVGTRDIAMIHSVTDIVGMNRMTERLLSCAAGAIMGMVQEDPGLLVSSRPLVAITMMGGINRAAFLVKRILEERGSEVVAFHTIGAGGRAMEEAIEQGLINGVLDLSTHELIDHLYGGFCDAGPTRLEAAGKKGIPQIVVPGCLDFISFTSSNNIPEDMRNRKVYMHTPGTALFRANIEEMSTVGKRMAEKLNRATGPTAVIIPLKGFSPGDREGKVLYAPEADKAFTQALKENLKPHVKVIELEAHINDDLFAEKAVTLLYKLMH